MTSRFMFRMCMNQTLYLKAVFSGGGWGGGGGGVLYACPDSVLQELRTVAYAESVVGE
jgi:hypothetical protein